MRREQVLHVKELILAAQGGPTRRDAIIQDSWLRCVTEHKLDPSRLQEAYIHPQASLREHQDAMDAFLRVARQGLESCYQQVCGQGYVLILTDAQGVAVDFIGDPLFDGQLRKAGLYRGADWNERLAGTCAVGTCIATGEALTVHQDDHFDGTHLPLTCSAAPVFGTDGKLAAVLDISALQSPSPKNSQLLARRLVSAVAHKIEAANLCNRYRHDWIVQLSTKPEFADVDPDCMFALDDAGRIIGLNGSARRLLLRTRPDASGRLVGTAFTDLFDTRLDDLPRYGRERAIEQRMMTLRSDGTPFFALSHRPSPRATAVSPSKPAMVPSPLAALAHGDPAMTDLVRRAARLVDASLSLLIQGETGTGKEHVARALHRASARAAKPFVAVNCAALPESLIESELFGHEPGAFTGAHAKGKRGLVLEAQGGTLFLDEIGDMPLALQTRMLRVLSEHEVMPVGRNRPISVDIKVIAATHRDLRAMMRDGLFREDLYFRLNGAVFNLPPLRLRTDFDALANQLLRARAILDTDAWAALRAHNWPGNIRELASVLDYAVAVAEGGLITRIDIEDGLAGSFDCRSERTSLEQARAESPLQVALRQHSWNVSAVARDLGVDRGTIHRRMRRLRLLPPNRLH